MHMSFLFCEHKLQKSLTSIQVHTKLCLKYSPRATNAPVHLLTFALENKNTLP